MQLAVAILLGVLYLRLTQALIGVFPGGGIILGWFATGFLAYLICAFLPRRWQDTRPYGPPPRRVHLSWRSAVLLPVMIPWVLFPGNFLWQCWNEDWDQAPSRRWRVAVADGTVVSGWGWDFRYKVPVGFDVPVFYDPRNPKHYVVACGSWFEAD